MTLAEAQSQSLAASSHRNRPELSCSALKCSLQCIADSCSCSCSCCCRCPQEARYPSSLLEHRRNANPNQLKLRPETKTALLEFYRPHNAWLRRLFPEAALEGWDDWVD